jgi:hypothetical protein
VYKVLKTIGDIAKPGDYAEKGFFKDEDRLLSLEAIEAVDAKEKLDHDAVILKAEKPQKEIATDQKSEVKKA